MKHTTVYAAKANMQDKYNKQVERMRALLAMLQEEFDKQPTPSLRWEEVWDLKRSNELLESVLLTHTEREIPRLTA
jgi:hypothetical protein